MTRVQIIDDLMACLGAISPENGFQSRPAELRRGIHLAEDLNDLPGLCLFSQRVESADQTGARAERRLVLHLWGAAPAPQGDFRALDALAADCLQALARPELNPHWQATTIGDMELYEGGAADPLGLFDLEITVSYEAGLGEL